MKNKAMLSIILVMILLLQSCGTQPTDDRLSTDSDTVSKTDLLEQTQTEEETFVEDAVPDLDFGGYVFKIIGHGDDNVADDLLIVEEHGDLVNDAKVQCFYKLEERFNITVKNFIVTRASRTVYEAILSGSTDFDAQAINLSDSIKYMAEHIFIPVKDLEYVDLNQPYWDNNFNKEMSVMNKNYLLLGDMFTRTALWTNVIMYNKDLLKNYDFESPIDLVRNSKWTLEKFNEIASSISSDIDGDGSFSANDLYGLAASDASMANIFNSSGLRVTTKNNDDIPVLAPFDSKMASVLEKALQLQNENNTTLVERWDVIYNCFREGRALFYAEILYKMGLMRDVEANIGVLPCPKYDESQERYLTAPAETILALSVPVTSPDPARTGAILEAYASVASQTVRPALFDTTLTYKDMRDENDIEMLDIILDSVVYDISIFRSFGNMGKIFSNSLINGKNNYSSSYESNYEKSQTELNKWTANFSEKD